MFKSLVIDPAFQSVALISVWLKQAFGGNGSDFAASWIMIACLMIVIGCYEALVGKRTVKWLAARFGVLLLLVLCTGPVIRFFAAEVVKIDARVAKFVEGHASRVKLSDVVLKKLLGRSWHVVETHGSHPLAFPSLQTAPYEEPSRGVLAVARDGGGRYFLKGDLLYFSSQFSDGGATTHWLVIVKPWAATATRMAQPLSSALVVVMLGAWLIGIVLRPLVHDLRHPGFLIIGTLFLAYYGSHQWRFLGQDARMQMVTSRDDDGYMMARLELAGTVPSMDPFVVSNNAYGAIAYHPFAALPAAGGLLGFHVSTAALNAFVRGIKLLNSLLMLAAVWVLARRHFGGVEAVVATAYAATSYGFLKYSSYPFYPDVSMAAFAVLAMSYSLDLLDEWSDRSFLLATVCAAMSVAIKFISFLVFPLLVFCIAWRAWQMRSSRAAVPVSFAVARAAAFVAVCVAVFFLCNPYLDYTLRWIVPNMTSVQNLYTAETPQQVVPAAASWSLWLSGAYLTTADRSVWIAAVMSLGFAVVWSVSALVRRPIVRSPASGSGSVEFHPVKTAVLLLLAVCWTLYFFKSITLPGAVDERLVLAVYPLFFILAVQCGRAFWPALRLGAARRMCAAGGVEAGGAS